MLENKIVNFKCSSCHALGYVCRSYTNNLIMMFFNYYLAKISIINDPKGYLEDTFDIFNFRRMQKGGIAILLDYFENDIIMADIVEPKIDHNNRIIGARVIIAKTNFQTEEVNVVDWKLFKEERKIELEAYLEAWGWTTTKNYKTIFFLNNLTWTPSLSFLDSILEQLHDLVDISEKNHCMINAIYIAKSDKKPTKEQANNISLTKTKDGFGFHIVDWNSTKIGAASTNSIPKEIITTDLNKWVNIKDEWKFLKEEFYEMAGITTQKLNGTRENLSETMSRFSRVGALEKNYFKFIDKFIGEYEEYFNIKVEVERDTTIKNMLEATINENLKLANQDKVLDNGENEENESENYND